MFKYKNKKPGLILSFLFLFYTGCAATSSLTDTEDGGQLETGAPVDIPVPMAKAVNGVDATTVRFNLNTDGNLSTLPMLSAAVSDSEAVGILSGHVIEVGTEQIVGLVADGEFIDFKTTSDEFTFNLSAEMYNKSLALVVLSSTSTQDDINLVSYPVIATVFEPNLLFDSHQTQVEITNTNNSTHGVVSNRAIALSADGIVGFTGMNSEGNPFIGVMQVEGQLFETLTDDIVSELEFLQYDINENLYGGDSENHIVRMTSLGEVLTETLDLDMPSYTHSFRVSPDGNWVASAIQDPDDTEVSIIVNLARSDTLGLGVKIRPEITRRANSVQTVWLDNNTLAVMKIFSDIQANIEIYDVTSFVAGDGSEQDVTVIPDTVVNSPTSRLGFLQADPNNSDVFIYACGDMGDVCLYQVSSRENTVLINDEDFTVLGAKFMADSENLVMQMDTIQNGEDDRSTHVIGIYNFENNTTTLLGKGLNPQPSLSDPKLAVYETYTDEDVIQIGVLNISHYGF